MEFNKKTVVITGGSGGIGKVVAAFFVLAGAHVVIASLNKRRIRKVIAELPRAQGTLLGIKTDVSSWSDIRKMTGQVLKKYKKIDVLVNCAGIQAPIGSFAVNRINQWRRNIEVNLLGTVMTVKAVLPHMLKRQQGKIINFSGGGSTSPRPNFSAYAVAKTAVVRFTEIIAEEVKKYGIFVNAISPGAVNTRMLQEVLRAGKKAGLKEYSEAMKRFKVGGTPPELAAKLILFLASKKSEPLTGRLISAVWDNWQKWDRKKIKAIMKSDLYTLRRIK